MFKEQCSLRYTILIWKVDSKSKICMCTQRAFCLGNYRFSPLHFERELKLKRGKQLLSLTEEDNEIGEMDRCVFQMLIWQLQM